MVNAIALIVCAVVCLVMGAIIGTFLSCACIAAKKADESNQNETDSVSAYNRGIVKGVAAGQKKPATVF